MTEDFKEIQNKPVNDLKGVDLHLSLSRLIRDKPGLVGCHINGGQQTGKSSYAMLVLWELYQHDVDKVLEHIVFNIKTLAEVLNTALENKERQTCIVWDDCSVSGAAMQYRINTELVAYISALGDTMGLATKSILLTSPSGDIIKAFKNYNFYEARIGFGRHKYDRIAKCYQHGKSPYKKDWYRTVFTDTFDTRIPWYDRYYKMRNELSISTVRDLQTFLNKKEKKERFSYDKHGHKYIELPDDITI